MILVSDLVNPRWDLPKYRDDREVAIRGKSVQDDLGQVLGFLFHPYPKTWAVEKGLLSAGDLRA